MEYNKSMEFKLLIKKKAVILALGAESAGNFSVYFKNKIFLSEDFGDLLEEKNWRVFQKTVLEYLKENRIKPDIILTDLHPLFNTTLWGKELAQKYKAKHIQVQHHHAHIFSAIGDKLINSTSYKLPATSYAIAMDGTGYGLDGKIWGGEVFKIKSEKYKVESIERIGHLENQIMIGGDLAIREPVRMLISILNKFLSKKEIYNLTNKYYSKNKFELLYNQLQQNFNCMETSSAGRVLDAVSILLGFCENVLNYKHEPIDLLEKNSGKPRAIHLDIQCPSGILSTTSLFRYILKYVPVEDLAAAAQLYIARGLYEIISKEKTESDSDSESDSVFSGGIANNKIISEYLISRGAYASKLIPRGDAGLSFGQVIYYLLSN